MHASTVSFVLLVACVHVSIAQGASKPCAFDKQSLSFEGTPVQQATCLLRQVKRYGNVAPEQPLPANIASLVGTNVAFDADDVRHWLSKAGISEEDLGGNLDLPLARAKAGDSNAPFTRYFVIHDTSTPNYGTKPIPSDINEKAWKHNDLSRWKEGNQSKAHLFVNRLGESLTAVKLDQPWRATKFEKTDGTNMKGLFMHVENIQPRRSLEGGSAGNDALAPDPGFADKQYERLALLYVAASVRRGDWLIPAFHCVLDLGLNGHDDPQNFDLAAWDTAVGSLVLQIASVAKPVATAAPASAATAFPVSAWDRAEYAVRWYPKNGGPATAQEVIGTLFPAAPKPKQSAFTVRYHDWTSEPAVPTGTKPILRERENQDVSDDERFELTYKIRSDAEFDVLEGWCALPDAEKKRETDISAVDDKNVRSAYSVSCTATSKSAMPHVPPVFSSTPKPCHATVFRLMVKPGGEKVKIETWQLPGDDSMIEVSRSGNNSAQHIKKFQEEIVVPLLAAGAKPIAEGKTSAASTCPGA